MAIIRDSFSNFVLLTTLVVLFIALAISGIVLYVELRAIGPFFYEKHEIIANPYNICIREGAQIEYDLGLNIREIGYSVVLHTSFYDIDKKLTVSAINNLGTIIREPTEVILLAHDIQKTNGVRNLPLTYTVPTYLYPGEFYLFRVADVDDRNSQYYAVKFRLLDCTNSIDQN